MTYLILFTSGLLTALPFIFPKLWFFAWFAASPLFFIAARKKSAYRHGIAFFAGFYGLLYYWFTCLYPMDFAGFDNLQSILLIAVCWIGLTALQGLVFAIVPVLYRKLRTSNVYADPFLSASLWVIFEWLQTQTWMGVPWGRLAVSQYAMLPAIQTASLLGSLFVSFLIILSNGFIASAAIKLAEGNFMVRDKRPLVCVAIAFAILGANLLYGKTALFIYSDDDAVTVTAAVIQGNIASGDKWADDSVKNSLLIYTNLTIQAATKYSPQLILWPETVITTSLREESYVRDNISELAKATGAVILVGAYDYVDDAKTGDYDRYNAIYAFYPNGSVSEQSYYKRHIVPFGEYLPSPWFFKTFIPVLANMNVFKYDLTPGTETNLIDSDYGKLGGLVCFDSIYEELARQSVNDGANLIVLSTNDSWYRDSAAVYQHNGHAVLRAVENGRYIVRAANTGVSTVISPTGEILTMLAPLTEGYAAANVKMLENRTVYSYIGDTWIIACAVFAASLVVVKIRRARGNVEARRGAEPPHTPA